jgi:ribosomal protein L22
MSDTPEKRDEELKPTEAEATDATDEVTPTAADETAAEEAADVELEADDEAEGVEEAPQAEAPDADEAAEAPAPVAAPDADEADADEADADEAAEAPAPVAAPEAEEKPKRARRSRGGGEPAKPAAAPRRGRRERPAGPPPVVRAQARYVRSSARKARLVCDNIRGKSVEEARAILAHTPRAIARDWSKLLESAVANAEHNHSLDGEDLYVKAVHADEGPTIKRFRPRAMGRATKIRKRTTHLTILLTPKD